MPGELLHALILVLLATLLVPLLLMSAHHASAAQIGSAWELAVTPRYAMRQSPTHVLVFATASLPYPNAVE